MATKKKNMKKKNMKKAPIVASQTESTGNFFGPDGREYTLGVFRHPAGSDVFLDYTNQPGVLKITQYSGRCLDAIANGCRWILTPVSPSPLIPGKYYDDQRYGMVLYLGEEWHLPGNCSTPTHDVSVATINLKPHKCLPMATELPIMIGRSNKVYALNKVGYPLYRHPYIGEWVLDFDGHPFEVTSDTCVKREYDDGRRWILEDLNSTLSNPEMRDDFPRVPTNLDNAVDAVAKALGYAMMAKTPPIVAGMFNFELREFRTELMKLIYLLK